MMNQPPVPNLPPDGLDRLLGDYFKDQLPKRWPAPPRTGSIRPANRRAEPVTDTLSPSRWALAASVVLLLGGCWCVSHQSADGQPRTNSSLENSTANLKIVKDLGKKTR